MGQNAVMKFKSWVIRAVLAIVALGCVAVVGFLYATRADALRDRLERLLARLDLRVVDLRDIRFSPWNGLEVFDLSLQRGGGETMARADAAGADRIRIPYARLSYNKAAMWSGRFQIEEALLDKPVWTHECASAGDVAPREGVLHAESFEFGRGWSRLPRITIESGEISILKQMGDEMRLLRRWVVRGRGRRQNDAPGEYSLRFEQVGGPVVRSAGAQATLPPLLEATFSDGEFRASSGWMDFQVLSQLAPVVADGLSAVGSPSAIVRVDSLVVRSGELCEVMIEVDRVECDLPIETEPGPRFARIRGGRGSVRYVASASAAQSGAAPGRLAVDFLANLDVGAVRMSGELELSESAREFVRSASHADWSGWRRAVRDARMLFEARGIELPNASENAAFIHSTRLPSPVRAFFRDYDPRGKADVVVRVGSDERGELSVEGYVEPLGGQATSDEFPYTWHDLTGRVSFSPDRIRVENLRGRHGSALLRINGHANHSHKWTGFVLDVDASHVPLDEDLYRALPAEHRALWNEASPSGMANVVVSLRRDEGDPETGPRKPEIVVGAQIVSGGVTVGPTRLSNADGWTRIHDQSVEVRGLYGHQGDSAIGVRGGIALPADGSGSARWTVVEAANVPFSREVPVRESVDQPLGTIRFEGTADVWGAERGPGVDASYTARVIDGTLTAFGGAPWTEARGMVVVGGGTTRLRDLTARCGADRVRITGDIPTQWPGDGALRLDVRAECDASDKLLEQLIPRRWSGLREALGAGGSGTVSLSLRSVDGGALLAEAQTRFEHMRPPPLPLALGDVQADFSFSSGGFELRSVRANCGESGVIEGRGRGVWGSESAWSELFVRIESIGVNAAFIDAMPKPLAGLLRRLALRGVADGTLDRVHIDSDASEWELIGKLRLQDAAMSLGLPLESATGELAGACRMVRGQGVSLDLTLHIDAGLLAGRAIERWEARVTGDPGDAWLRVDELRGRIADGEVFGEARIEPDSGAHEIALTLSDLRLSDLFRSRSPGAASRRDGRVDGRVFVRAASSDPSARTGGGELRIRGASLLSSPVTAQILDSSAARGKPDADSVDEAEIRFVWEGDELKLSHVDIRGRSLRLVGDGTWNFRTDRLSMTLLGAGPDELDRLGALGTLLESAGRELAQFRVEGTSAQPRVTVEPLHNLTEPIRRLLSGARGR